jgi:hypothetical protein
VGGIPCSSACTLLVGIVQLGEGVRELHPARECFESLDQARLRPVVLREWRELLRVVDDERRVDDLRLDVLGEQVVHELSPDRGRVELDVLLLRRGDQRVAVAELEHVEPRLVADRVAQCHAPPRA